MSQSSRKTRRARAAAERKRRRPLTHADAKGRVHLVLHRDPNSGEELLSLTTPVFKEIWQNELAVATANTAHGILRGEPTRHGTVELALSAMAGTSKLADGLLARAPEGAVACKAGCDHCCYQSVGVTPPEALAIFDHLTSSLSSSQLEQVATRLSVAHDKTRGLSSKQRFSPDHPCPFLQEARCSIYEVRPLSCRGMNSLDAEECSSRLRDPEVRAVFLQKGVGGRSFMEPIRAFHAVSAGLQLSLSELYHLDMRPLDLTAALHLLLSGTAPIAEDWLSGKSAFEPARGGDNTNQPGIGELSGTRTFVSDRHG